jgi:hypothetical protein
VPYAIRRKHKQPTSHAPQLVARTRLWDDDYAAIGRQEIEEAFIGRVILLEAPAEVILYPWLDDLAKVDVVGFEPTASRFQGEGSIRAELHPEKSSTYRVVPYKKLC